MMNIEIYSEAEISWQLHNEIHAVLNRAYAHRTNAFRCKTYGGIQPLKRVIFRDQGMIVGHTAIFGTQVRFEDEWINVGGVGMTCSLRPLKKIGG